MNIPAQSRAFPYKSFIYENSYVNPTSKLYQLRNDQIWAKFGNLRLAQIYDLLIVAYKILEVLGTKFSTCQYPALVCFIHEEGGCGVIIMFTKTVYPGYLAVPTYFQPFNTIQPLILVLEYCIPTVSGKYYIPGYPCLDPCVLNSVLYCTSA